jgi:predicted amidohydrolase YtcJ
VIDATVIIRNGQVVTVDAQDRIAGAVAIYDDKIVCVGSEEEAMAFAGPDTKIIDAGGGSVLPGFIDGHVHGDCIGNLLVGVDCSSKNVRSITDIQEKIRECADATPKGELIRAFGYDQMELEERRHPTKEELDDAAPDHPVHLSHMSFHMSVLNSKGLEKAGVGADIPDPVGGVFVRENGELTGLAQENANWIVVNALPYTEEEITKSWLIADSYLSERGITSVHDAGGVGAVSWNALVELKRAGKINTRIYHMIFSISGNAEFINHYYDIGFHTGFGSSSHKMGPLKIMIDGSSMGGTSALRSEYSDNPGFTGILAMTQEQIDEAMLRAHRANYQLTAHAIGDRAVEMLLDAYDKCFAEKPRKDARPRIEHCAIVDEELISRIKKLGAIPVLQPEFNYTCGDTYREHYGERADWMMTAERFRESGIPAVFSTDCPVIEPGPYHGLFAACTCVTSTGKSIAGGKKMKLLDAIRMYTYNGAYASFEEEVKGSIEVGKLADIVVSDKPILSIPIKEVREVNNVLTMIGGKVVYEK